MPRNRPGASSTGTTTPQPRRLERSIYPTMEGERFEVPITVVSPNPRNLRGIAGRDISKGLGSLVASVAKEGILHGPLVMSRAAFAEHFPDSVPDLPAEAEFVLIDGHRRRLAALRVGHSVLPVELRNALAPRADQIIMHENLNHEDLDPIEEAIGYRRLNAGGMTLEAMAEMFNRSKSHISKRMALLALADGRQADVAEGRVGVDVAYTLLTKFKDTPPDLDRAWTMVLDAHRRGARLSAKEVIETVTGIAQSPVLPQPRSAPPAPDAMTLPPDRQEKANGTRAEAPPPLVPTAEPQPPAIRPVGEGSEDHASGDVSDRNGSVKPAVSDEQPAEAAARREAEAARAVACRALLAKQVHPDSPEQITIDLARAVITTASAQAWELARSWLSEDQTPVPGLDETFALPHHEQVRVAGQLAIAQTEIATRRARQHWGTSQAAYLGMLTTEIGYTPTEWETHQLARVSDRNS